MPIFDGVVTIRDDLVPVLVVMEDDGLRLSSNGTEIGEWGAGEFSIDDQGNGTYGITADEETLEFVPNRPDLFAAGLGRPAPMPKPGPEPSHGDHGDHGDHGVSQPEPTVADIGDAPTPQPLTRALFYTLAGTTAALGLWALYRLIA